MEELMVSNGTAILFRDYLFLGAIASMLYDSIVVFPLTSCSKAILKGNCPWIINIYLIIIW